MESSFGTHAENSASSKPPSSTSYRGGASRRDADVDRAMRERRVYVVATTRQETQHALEWAEMLASSRQSTLTVVVPVPAQLQVSSGRAHAYSIPVDDPEHPDPGLGVAEVRALVGATTSALTMVATTGFTASHLASVLPTHATVVLCGPMHRFIETREQRVARELAKRQFDVVFLPYRDALAQRDDVGCETDMIRQLRCA